MTWSPRAVDAPITRSVTRRHSERYELESILRGDVAEACHHFGVVGLPYGVLSGGTLTGKYITGKDTPRSRQNLSPDFQPRYNGPLAVEATKAYANWPRRGG